MMDDADIAELRRQKEEEIRGTFRYDIPTGVPGLCEKCGGESPRLVGGKCVPCRDREERQRGFTVIELLTAMTIILILAAVAMTVRQDYRCEPANGERCLGESGEERRAIRRFEGVPGVFYPVEVDGTKCIMWRGNKAVGLSCDWGTGK